jgi:outer membrane protein insertion porin family
MKRQLHFTFLLICLLAFTSASAQSVDSIPNIKYNNPADYEIGGVEVIGNNYSDATALKSIAGLNVGDKIRIPGPGISNAIKALWKLKLFTDVKIYATKTVGEIIFLELLVQERPRLSTYAYKGAKKSRHSDLNDAVNRYLTKGGIVTESIKKNAIEAIKGFYKGKGFLDAEVNVREFIDSARINSVRLEFHVDRKDKVKIKDITISGNHNVKAKKLIKQFKETKVKRKLFASSKLVQTDYEADKDLMIAYYNTLGFRDARVIKDSIWRNEDGELMIHLDIHEGNRYYFRNMTWKGNSIYDDATLSRVLGIIKGDIYNEELLQTRLQFDQAGRDISTLYMDNGYLFFNITPIEVAVVGDSIDLEFRISEGPQATIDKVVIKGNDRTHEHVIRRELRTRPGQKFSRSDIIRSQREIINLGYFNPEALDINTPVNPQRGTVDIEYTVEEKPSDQLELSAGWGGFQARVIGTLGVTFNNFSLRNIFNKSAWHPLPQGDGQRLSLRAQTNGNFYQSYNASFTEPWLGGKKPNALTVAGSYTKLTNGRNKESPTFNSLSILRGAVSLGTRLKWPDDNFISSTTISISEINLNNRATIRLPEGGFLDNGSFKNLSINQTIARSSISDPLFPRSGSKIQLSLQVTPPYSLFSNKDYSTLPAEERFKWLEYHKWKIDAEWYSTIVGNLVAKVAGKIGILGAYNKEIGTSPFERFELGGDGLSNQSFAFTGNEIISLRGYEVEDINGANRAGTPAYTKFTFELRYPLTTNPNSTIYALLFAQAGNAYETVRDFNPFDLRRSIGGGVRVFLPMFGTLGFDYGFGFDNPNIDSKKLFDYGNFNIILGFEPE